MKNQDFIQVIRGPRQCGKTSLVLHLGKEFKELSLDDPALRNLAQEDPELFLKQFQNDNIFIDEAQYAPELFPSLKRRVDLFKRENPGNRKTLIRLTGSNQILMDKTVKESLAGRASFFDLNTLSVSEILESTKMPIQEILYRGGWPELIAQPDLDPHKYLDNYINSYIEKDIVLSAGIQKSREFLKFTALLSGRVGQLLDLSNLGKGAGVDAKTSKDWISVLEKMHIISLVQPYSTNLKTRLVKSPKVYFLDTGLACRLQGWTSPRPILTSPQQGALFENLVYAEIQKMISNYQLGWKVFHWRSRDKEEIDFLIQKNPNEFVFIEAKTSSQKVADHHQFPAVKKIFKSNIPTCFVCHQEGERVLADQVPIAFLKKVLLDPRSQELA